MKWLVLILVMVVNSFAEKVMVYNTSHDRQVQEDIELALTKNPYVILVDRDYLEQVIKEQSLHASGMMDESTTVELGKLVGADRVFIVSYDKESNYPSYSHYTTIKIISIKNGSVVDMKKGNYTDVSKNNKYAKCMSVHKTLGAYGNVKYCNYYVKTTSNSYSTQTPIKSSSSYSIQTPIKTNYTPRIYTSTTYKKKETSITPLLAGVFTLFSMGASYYYYKKAEEINNNSDLPYYENDEYSNATAWSNFWFIGAIVGGVTFKATF